MLFWNKPVVTPLPLLDKPLDQSRLPSRFAQGRDLFAEPDSEDEAIGLLELEDNRNAGIRSPELHPVDSSQTGLGSLSTIKQDLDGLQHGDLPDLDLDQHLQYHTNARGDARYYTQTQLRPGSGFSVLDVEDGFGRGYRNATRFINSSVGAGHAGFAIKLNSSGRINNNMLGSGSGFVSDAFKTIDCASGTDPVADSLTDTLQLLEGSTKITVTGDSSADSVTFDVVEANIDHDALSNFVVNEHIDHSAVSIIAGTLLTGGGDLTSSRTLNVDEGSIDHGSIAGLSDDDHSIYPLLAGRSGGQGGTFYGGTGSGDDWNFQSTSHSTKGTFWIIDSDIKLGTNDLVDPVLTFVHDTADGVLTWDGSADQFQFSDDIVMAGTERIFFGDSNAWIYSVAPGEIQFANTSGASWTLSSVTTGIVGNVSLSTGSLSLSNDATTLRLGNSDDLTFGYDGGDAIMVVDAAGADDGHLRIRKGNDVSVATLTSFTDTLLVTHLDTTGSSRTMLVYNEFANTVADANFHTGFTSHAYHTGSAGLTKTTSTGGLSGIVAGARLKSDQTVAKAVGIWVQARIENTETGTITAAHNFYSEGIDAEDGTITNAYGYYGVAHLKDSGTLTNAYGIYLEEQTAAATINYEMFLAGAGEIFFRDSGIHIGSLSDGHLTLTADIRVDLTPTTIDQSSTSGAVPPLIIDQADISEEMLEFVTTIGTGNAIEAVGAKALTTTHFIKVTIPGGLTRYIPCGTIA